MFSTQRFLGNSDGAHDSQPRAGVLLVNIGTPDAPTPHAVRRYLAEFLSDPRVIELPRWIWWLILHGVILRIRPRKSARAYAKIWTDLGSPLLVNSEILARRLGSAFSSASRPDLIRVSFAMRYGQPSIAHALEWFEQQNVRRLLVLPLYPQYSATTTGSVFNAITTNLQRRRWLPELRCINEYHAEQDYIFALAKSVENFWAQHGRSERLLLSFHGIPERYSRAGDPYFHQCQTTAKLLREQLGLNESTLIVSFQSRVGYEPWLKPYTSEMLTQLVHEGVRHVQVLCPGFAVDCLETLEEIVLRDRKYFLSAGGKRFDYIPALNATDAHVEALIQLILRHTQGWPEFSSVGSS